MALLWMFRKNISIEGFTFYGWSHLFPNSRYIDDGVVAVFCALILFLTPSTKGDKLLLLEDLKTVPWETVLLFGGGFAIAGAFQKTGLTVEIAKSLSAFSSLNYFLVLVVLTFMMSFVTELTSNMSSTELVLPVLIPLAHSMHVEPIILMIPVTLAASCAFMLPAATAPNSVIFSTGRINVKDMVKTGFLLNIVSVIVISMLTYYLAPLILKIYH